MNESLAEQFADLERRRATQSRRFYASKPKPINSVLAQVMQRKGYAQIKTGSDRDEAWAEAAGEFASATQVGALRRGVLQIVVANSLQMQELTFRKEELIKKLQTALPEAGIKQLKFRVGRVNK